MANEPTLISKKILYLLNEKGISANKLQNDLKLSNNAVTYWKSGRSSPSQKTLEKIADYFNLPLSYFYDTQPSSFEADDGLFVNCLERILTLIKTNGLNDRSAEEAIGLKKGTLFNWKSNRAKPSVDNLIKVAQYFHVSIDYLVGLSDNPEIKTEPPTEVKGSVSYADILRKYGVSEESVPVLDEIDIAKIKAYIQGLIDSKRNK